MCDYEICRYGGEVAKNLDALNPVQKAFFTDLYERMCSAGADPNYYRAILDGSWPSARKILHNSLDKITWAA
jgi:hypothetical protein